jgi:four helix bundle protein
MSMRSASELQHHLLLARDLGYLDATAQVALDDLIQELKRMLASLIGEVRSARSH